MSNIQFEIKELLNEFQLMRQLAKPFLREESLLILDELNGNLKNLRRYKGTMQLEVKPDRPIKTKYSEGKYEKGGGGRHCIQAELCFVWELKPITRQASRRVHRHVQLSGKASTVTTLYAKRDGSSSKIAHWRLEIGDSSSPGFYFHAQIPETLNPDDGMWPKWLPVPRLPVPPFTPMLALEFVLGEIFQDEWPAHLNSRSIKTAAGQWRNIHKNRFSRYFEWHQQATVESVSPLIALKQAKPRSEMFILT